MSNHREQQDPTLNLATPQNKADAGSMRCPCLRVLTGSFAGRLYRFTAAEMTMGRAPDNDIVLETAGVSRVHARLSRTAEGGILLTDLGSTNGTFVGGKAITSHLLQEGDQIGLATQVIIRFSQLGMLEEQLEEQIYQRASLDGLTGALNRRAYLERLATQYEAARARDLVLSVVRIDADHFNRVKDSLGQSAGDAVLVELARRFRHALGAGEWLGRLGGEEFSLLLPGCQLQSAVERVERLRREAEATPVRVPGNRELEITLSAGLSTLLPEHGAAWEALLKSADLALYQAKEGGRNRVVAFDSPSGSSRTAAPPAPKQKPSLTSPPPPSGKADTPRPAPVTEPARPARVAPPPRSEPILGKNAPKLRQNPQAAEAETPRTALSGRINANPPAPPSPEPVRRTIPQRRRMTRLPCQFAISCLGADRVSFNGVIRDMSFHGLRVELPRALEPGAMLALVPSKDNLAVTVRVVWCKPSPTPGLFLVGATYQISSSVLERSWVKPTLQSLGIGRIPVEERRGRARVATHVQAVINLETGKVLPGRTVNVGSHGCLLDCPKPLEAGQRVQLSLGPLPDGSVVMGPAWVVHASQGPGPGTGWRCGLMFETWETAQMVPLEAMLCQLMSI